ncbi:DUF4097 family beta strand repeat-containing protein [Eupransor demetentiae]|uniref:Contains DUF4097 and DUF4098 domains (YvlB) n=1 Tax=Eupransor demetentiae TaxID=3109584 RepID=A0ABM9N4W5_9LACO|nr:Uncharacterized conserved protein YvlB [Lactobacillaceae bacterium LMG 33000]
MNKSIKWGIGLLVVGATMTGTALAVKGPAYISWQNGLHYGSYSKDSQSTDVTGGHLVNKGQDIHEVKVDMGSSDVTVQKGDHFAVYAKGMDKKDLDWTLKDGVLSVSEKGHPFTMHLGFSEFEQLVITVPSDVELDQISLSSDSGDQKISGLTAKRLMVKNDSGDQNLKNVTVTQGGFIHNDSGDIHVSNSRLPELWSENDSGDTHISKAYQQKSGNATPFRISNDSGDIELD